jgi:apoptosis-inducing factor 2
VRSRIIFRSVVCLFYTVVFAESAPQNKKVTLVQSSNMLLNKAYPDKFRLALDRGLKVRGVEIIYNDFIDEIPAEGVVGVTTRNGNKLDADLVVSTLPPL